MKVVALGDAHLGRNAGPVMENGINRRELDFDESFTRVVDLALARQPDLFVWLGDIFDKPNPSYRSYRVAQRELAKIRDHGIPLVSISGNHDTPRVAGTGSPYRPLEDIFSDFNFAPGFERRSFEYADIVVHCVPQMASVQATLDALAEVRDNRSADKTNLLLTHPRVPQVEPRYDDLNEITVDASALDCDLVLLGHYHSHREVAKGIWYAGAPDAFGFADEFEDPKGFVVLDTTTGLIDHVALDGRRPMVHPFPIDARGIGPDEVTEKIAAVASEAPDGRDGVDRGRRRGRRGVGPDRSARVARGRRRTRCSSESSRTSCTPACRCRVCPSYKACRPASSRGWSRRRSSASTVPRSSARGKDYLGDAVTEAE